MKCFLLENETFPLIVEMEGHPKPPVKSTTVLRQNKKITGKYILFPIPKSQAPRVAFDGPALYFQYKVKLVDFSTVWFLNALKLGTEVDHNTDSMFPTRAACVEGCARSTERMY